MQAILSGNKIIAKCPNCRGAVSNFLFNDDSGSNLGSVSTIKENWVQGYRYEKMDYRLARCAGCGRGGLAEIYRDAGLNKTHFADFYPHSLNHLRIPASTPEGIASEFFEAEVCASVGAYRAGAAMLRSTLEKTLKDHGYTEWKLSTNLKNLGEDGIIPIPLKEKATSIVKVLGDDVMHKEWREIEEEEFEEAHKYTQKILDAFYDDAETVKKILIQKRRLTEKEVEELNGQESPEGIKENEK